MSKTIKKVKTWYSDGTVETKTFKEPVLPTTFQYVPNPLLKTPQTKLRKKTK